MVTSDHSLFLSNSDFSERIFSVQFRVFGQKFAKKYQEKYGRSPKKKSFMADVLIVLTFQLVTSDTKTTVKVKMRGRVHFEKY